MIELIKLIGGLVLLLVSGDYLVKGGVNLARHLNLSTMVVAVTVVAFGTSAPELIVSVQAAIHGHPDIAMGNVIGSNISNIALVLATAAIILPISVRSNSVVFDWPIMMLSGVLLYIFGLNGYLNRIEGVIFVVLLLGFIFFSIRNSRKARTVNPQKIEQPNYSMVLSILMVLLSCIGLAFGADILVDGASEFARTIGVSERVISISLVALGTSLPELVTSVMAAIRKEMDISIGNIIGSNIFNTFAVLGITGTIAEIKISKQILDVDIWWMLAIFILLFLFIIPLKGGKLTRWKGSILLTIYIVYMVLLFISK